MNGLSNKAFAGHIHPSYGGLSALDLTEVEKRSIQCRVVSRRVTFNISNPIFSLTYNILSDPTLEFRLRSFAVRIDKLLISVLSFWRVNGCVQFEGNVQTGIRH